MNKFVGIALILLLSAGSPADAAGRRRAVQQPQGFPPAYADLYLQLAAQLDAAQARLTPLHPERGQQPIYAAELLPANANRGPALLQPGVIDGVRAFLDRFQQLGIRGVVFALGYPLLLDRYPNSSQYLSFYQQVMAETRKRGMIVDIESAVIFANSPFSPIVWDYSKTTFSQFVQDRHDMTAKIVSQLAPDYLDLGAEPDTEAKLTGYAQLNVPSTYAQSINDIIRGIDRGSTRIGVGLGTWNSVAFIDAETQLPIDFIALHIYPIDSGSISTAFQGAEIARARGKQVIIDEAWLYKAKPGESSSIAADADIFARDTFSFFVPLDEQFLHLLDDFARVEGVTLISPFWSTYLFAYLPYSPATASLPYDQIVAQVNRAATANILAGQYTPTGYSYAALIAGRGY